MQKRYRALHVGELRAFRNPQRIYPRHESLPFIVDGDCFSTFAEGCLEHSETDAAISQFETHSYIRRLVQTWAQHYDPLILETFQKGIYTTSMDLPGTESSDRQEIDRLNIQKNKAETSLAAAMTVIAKLREEAAERARSTMMMDFSPSSEKFFDAPKKSQKQRLYVSASAQVDTISTVRIPVAEKQTQTPVLVEPKLTKNSIEMQTERVELKNVGIETISIVESDLLSSSRTSEEDDRMYPADDLELGEPVELVRIDVGINTEELVVGCTDCKDRKSRIFIDANTDAFSDSIEEVPIRLTQDASTSPDDSFTAKPTVLQVLIPCTECKTLREELKSLKTPKPEPIPCPYCKTLQEELKLLKIAKPERQPWDRKYPLVE